MTAQAAKPGGLDSGVALREYRDQTTQRFAIQEKAFETLKLDSGRRCFCAPPPTAGGTFSNCPTSAGPAP